MQEYILRLFAGGYNTLYDSATSWLEPTEDALYDALDDLEESNIIVQEEEFVDFLTHGYFQSVTCIQLLVILSRIQFV